MKRVALFFFILCIVGASFPFSPGSFIQPSELDAATCTNLTRLLYRGASDAKTGGQVSRLQQFLREQGYFRYEVTGYFGTITERALQQFQRAYRIVSSGNPATTGYGLVGPRTRAKIKAVSGCPGAVAVPNTPVVPDPLPPEPDPALTAPPAAPPPTVPTTTPPRVPDVPNQNNNNNNNNNPNTTQAPGGGQSFNFTLYKDRSLNTYADSAVAWFTIGGASQDQQYRSVIHVGDVVPVSYYIDSFGPTRGDEVLARGYQRAFLHNPFGFSSTDTFPDGCVESYMQFDQYLEAQKDTPWLTNGFVQYWKPYIDNGVEVIAYIGSIDPFTPQSQNGDCDQRQLLGNDAAYWARAYAAIQPYLDAGMTIGFDAAVATNINSATYRLAQELRARGVRVYVEAVPGRDNPHWAAYPFLIYNDIWYFTGEPFAVPLDQLHRDILRFVAYPSDHVQETKQIMRDGYSVSAGEVYPLRQAIPDNIVSSTTIDVQLASALPSTTYRITTNPLYGTLVADPNVRGRYVYTAPSNFVGTDSFVFVINNGGLDSIPNNVNIHVQAKEPTVTASQLMQVAKQVSGATKVIATWPLFEREIQELGIRGMIPSTMVPKRVITLEVAGTPVSYIVGYNKDTFVPLAVRSSRILAGADFPSDTQYAAAATSDWRHPVETVRGWWHALIRFWEKVLFGME